MLIKDQITHIEDQLSKLNDATLNFEDQVAIYNALMTRMADLRTSIEKTVSRIVPVDAP
ncbi:MAG: hypothetical protein ACO3K7_06770 [Candidatus Marinamargulisbacteria bacterium]